MMSAALGPAVLLHSQTWQNRVDQWTARVMEHKSNLVSYLIVLRCVLPSLSLGYEDFCGAEMRAV